MSRPPSNPLAALMPMSRPPSNPLAALMIKATGAPSNRGLKNFKTTDLLGTGKDSDMMKQFCGAVFGDLLGSMNVIQDEIAINTDNNEYKVKAYIYRRNITNLNTYVIFKITSIQFKRMGHVIRNCLLKGLLDLNTAINPTQGSVNGITGLHTPDGAGNIKKHVTPALSVAESGLGRKRKESVFTNAQSSKTGENIIELLQSQNNDSKKVAMLNAHLFRSTRNFQSVQETDNKKDKAFGKFLIGLSNLEVPKSPNDSHLNISKAGSRRGSKADLDVQKGNISKSQRSIFSLGGGSMKPPNQTSPPTSQRQSQVITEKKYEGS
jgi:hypothetical protein